ncbi:MAG: ribosome recycling factor [Planctomycetales bacterium]|nr:ribosome recycling factor [Planctomycetales bacterium]
MSVDEILLDAEDRMEKAISTLKNNLGGIRTGRANPGLVDSVKVEAWGSLTPLKHLAVVGAPEPTQIVIRPHDLTIIKDIEKAIVASDLGFNPQNDGRVIRINVPPLSADVRRKMVARIKELAEETKVSMRNIRRDANRSCDQAEKDKTISEDMRDDTKEQIQELLKKYESEVGDLAKTREAEVTED